MKILCLSDLHLWFLNHSEIVKQYKVLIKKTLKDKQFDCIVVTGDIFEYTIVRKKSLNPYKKLSQILGIKDKPIICCLGNHEFPYYTVDQVKNHYASFTDRGNVHYLDIEGNFEFKGYNFVGNVLWYDNSLGSNPMKKFDYIVSTWLDHKIKDFIPSVECAKNKQQILDNLSSDKPNILLTHCVPHKDINWFEINQPDSIYNQYSGCANFLNQLKSVEYAISGHTHKVINKIINNVHCINTGNDYLNDLKEIKTFIIDTETKQVY